MTGRHEIYCFHCCFLYDTSCIPATAGKKVTQFNFYSLIDLWVNLLEDIVQLKRKPTESKDRDDDK